MVCPTLAFADTLCKTGACAFACLAGHADCDKVPATGCEADTGTDINCGACGTVARITPETQSPPVSKGFAPLAGCAAGFGDCDLKYETGCEVALTTDLGHCGVCGTACAVADGQPGCVMGACTVLACSPGFADCDMKPATGCEASLFTDTSNCGGVQKLQPSKRDRRLHGGLLRGDELRRPLRRLQRRPGGRLRNEPRHQHGQLWSLWCRVPDDNPPHRRRDVRRRQCGGTCSAGYADCDMNKQSNGCETYINGDRFNCGGCGTQCTAMQVCSGGKCGLNCDPGYTNCGGAGVVASDPKNCGACNFMCPAVANATPTCSTGKCGFACTADYADCTAAAGCETNIASDWANCNGCGAACTNEHIDTLSCSNKVCNGACASGGPTATGTRQRTAASRTSSPT